MQKKKIDKQNRIDVNFGEILLKLFGLDGIYESFIFQGLTTRNVICKAWFPHDRYDR